MDNHFHVPIEIPEGNLVGGMRRLNQTYTQYSNRQRRQVGHLLQGRYKGIVVDKDSHLLELCRYVVLNPVVGSLNKSLAAGRWWSECLTGERLTPVG